MPYCRMVALILLADLSVQSTPPPRLVPTMGPIGWEERITPGFSPPIEYVVVYGSAWFDPELKESDCPAKWGPGAIDVLGRLYHDAEWEPYRQKVFALLSMYKGPELEKFLTTDIAAVTARLGASGEQNQLLQLLGLLQKSFPERYSALLREASQEADSPILQTLVGDLGWRLDEYGDPGTRNQLSQILQMLPLESPLRSRVVRALDANKASQRAYEPMNIILKTEGAK